MVVDVTKRKKLNMSKRRRVMVCDEVGEFPQYFHISYLIGSKFKISRWDLH